MNLNYKILGFTFILFSFSLFSQKSDSTVQKNIKAKNAIFIEGFGSSASVLSLNYDRIIYQSKITRITVNVGFALFPISDPSNAAHKNLFYVYGVPVSGNLLFGKKKHYLEVGLGVSYSRGLEASFSSTGKSVFSEMLFFVPRVGYRFQRNQGGFFFRLGFTPLIMLKD
ncbi:MAG: hypothetical protein ACHQII_02760, partial [Bacteroidia bacterium]